MRFAHLCAVVGLAALAAPAFAQYSSVGTRAGLGGNDNVDWAQLGSEFATVNSGATANSTVNNVTATLTTGNGGTMQRRNQGNGWAGNFANGDAVLWTTGNGPLTILFSNLGANQIYGVGAQYQAQFYGGFTARLELLGAGNSVLAFYDFAGNSTDAGDNSAIFMGGQSSLGDILGVRFTGLTDADGFNIDPNDFGINQLSLKLRQANGGNTGGGGSTTGGGNNGGGGQNGGDPVPEPGEWAAMGILGAGLAGLVVRGRRRRAA